MAQLLEHFPTFNDYYFDRQNHTHNFPLFSNLPSELRLRIWDLAVQRNRILYLHIDGLGSEATEPTAHPYDSENDLGNRVSGAQYRWRLHSPPELDPLFHTCRESRETARRHYRICLPSNPRDTPTTRQLYLNPESDFLMIDIWKNNGPLFVDFLNDLKAYDPKGVGILQLGMNDATFIKLQDITLSSLSPAALKPFKETLENLRHVWAACLLHTSSRVMSGASGTHDKKYNRSCPIFSFSQPFQWLEIDPRPIASDLGRTTTWTNPSRMKYAWQDLEERFLGKRRNQPLKRAISYILTVKPECSDMAPRVVDVKSMDDYLDEEMWWWRATAAFLQVDDGIETIEKTAPLSAAGWWILPGETFDHLKDEEENGMFVADLTGCKPGLLLSDLEPWPGYGRGSMEVDFFWKDDGDPVRRDFEY